MLCLLGGRGNETPDGDNFRDNPFRASLEFAGGGREAKVPHSHVKSECWRDEVRGRA